MQSQRRHGSQKGWRSRRDLLGIIPSYITLMQNSSLSQLKKALYGEVSSKEKYLLHPHC